MILNSIIIDQSLVDINANALGPVEVVVGGCVGRDGHMAHIAYCQSLAHYIMSTTTRWQELMQKSIISR